MVRAECHRQVGRAQSENELGVCENGQGISGVRMRGTVRGGAVGSCRMFTIPGPAH